MHPVERSTDKKEEYSGNGLTAVVPGLVMMTLGGLLIHYQSSLTLFGILLAAAGVGAVIFGARQFFLIRKVTDHTIDCPFCDYRNHLTEPPQIDFRCEGCSRQVPIEAGVILKVYQVRCGFCNHLNYYSEKSTGLICEECDREIPIATDEETHAKKVFQAYTIHDDDQTYDLVLEKAPKSEEMISCLQHMLALNRNQVKDLLEEIPVTLLTGIPKKKAELLKAQLTVHDGQADFKVSG